MLPSFSRPPLEFCFGTRPIQAEKSRPDRNAFGSATLATNAVASAGPTRGSSSSRRLVSFEVPGVYLPVELQDLRLEPAEQRTQGLETRTRGLGDALVSLISNGVEQLLHAVASDRSNYAELG